MGIFNTAPLILPTRRTIVFTSSTTWTVPSSCIYADVMVVGGGQGGAGGVRNTAESYNGGTGGAITIGNNVYLGGTGTVAITVGAGGAGGAGSTTTTQNNGVAGGNSLFGTFIASGGGRAHGNPSQPGYRGTVNNAYNAGDTTLSNFTPIMQNPMGSAGSVTPSAPSSANQYTFNGDSTKLNLGFSTDSQYFGMSGGCAAASGSTGGFPGGLQLTTANQTNALATNRLPWGAHLLLTFGAATAGTAGAGGGAGGAAGVDGYSGGGGPAGNASAAVGGRGGPGAGGGGGNGNGGTTGGNGGNAGANTGAGGGSGGATGASGGGTGGTGGNGAAGFIIVSYFGIN
jgi:hypothetical protein